MADRTYAFLAGLGKALTLDVLGWEFEGGDHLPSEGPVIVAANHISYLDPPLVAALMSRPIRFMATSEVFQIPLLGRFLRSIGTFAVRRSPGDLLAVRQALRILERGEVLGIFPEGTRNRNNDLQHMLDFYEGVGWLAIRTQAPVVPLAIDGYRLIRPRSRWTRPTKLRITCGAPLWFDPDLYPQSKRPYRTEATQQVRRAINALLQREDFIMTGAVM